MTKERVCANEPDLSRRALFAALPVAGVALALPLSADAQGRDAVLEVIEELEAWQGWETSGVVAAKAYAAYRMREAMGLDLPDPENARMHLHFQQGSFDCYRDSYMFERDAAAGKVVLPPRSPSSI